MSAVAFGVTQRRPNWLHSVCGHGSKDAIDRRLRICRVERLQSERMTEIVQRALNGETGRVRLGFAGSSVNGAVSAVARRARRERPNLSLELFGSQLSQPGMERLTAGSLDAIIGRWDFLLKSVRSRVLAREELLVALPDDHPLAAASTLSAAELADQPWVVLPGGSGAALSNRLHILGARGRFVPRVVQTAPDSATQLLLVEAGAGIALTFSGVQQNLPAQAVVFRPLSPDLGPVEVRMAWRADDENPALAAVIGLAAGHGAQGSSDRRMR